MLVINEIIVSEGLQLLSDLDRINQWFHTHGNQPLITVRQQTNRQDMMLLDNVTFLTITCGHCLHNLPSRFAPCISKRGRSRRESLAMRGNCINRTHFHSHSIKRAQSWQAMNKIDFNLNWKIVIHWETERLFSVWIFNDHISQYVCVRV